MAQASYQSKEATKNDMCPTRNTPPVWIAFVIANKLFRLTGQLMLLQSITSILKTISPQQVPTVTIIYRKTSMLEPWPLQQIPPYQKRLMRALPHQKLLGLVKMIKPTCNLSVKPDSLSNRIATVVNNNQLWILDWLWNEWDIGLVNQKLFSIKNKTLNDSS